MGGDPGASPPRSRPLEGLVGGEPVGDDAGTRLRRVLAVATLTPQQAALLVSDVFAAPFTQRSDVPRTSFDDRRVRLSFDGELVFPAVPIPERLAMLELPPVPQLQLERASARNSARRVNGSVNGDLTAKELREPLFVPEPAAMKLARSLVSSVRRSPAYAEASAILQEEIDRVEQDLRVLGRASEHIRQIAEERLGLEDAEMVRGELAALAAATYRPDAVQPLELEPPKKPATVTEPVPPPPPARNRWGLRERVWHRKFRLPSRRLVLWTLLIAVSSAAAFIYVPRVVADLRATWDTLMNPAAPDQHFEPVSPPRERGMGVAPAPVPALAPSEAAPIESVAGSFADGPCQPGQLCTVRVDVELAPRAGVSVSSWTLHVADRCTGDTTEHPGLAMPVQPGARQAYGVSEVPLPESRSLAILAVTDAPTRAASRPLLVPADGGTC